MNPAPAFVVEQKTRSSQVTVLFALAAVVVCASLPLWGSRASMMTFVELFYFVALTQMWNLLAGYGGLLSIGQQAYIGLGAYTLVVMTTLLGVHPFIALLFAGPVAGVAGWLSLRLLFRLQGAYFAIGTWVVAEVLRLVFANISVLGGGSGISITSTVQKMDPWWRQAGTYWLALGLAVGAVMGVYLLLRGRYGLALTAVRDSPAAAQSLGVSVPAVKTWVYVLAATATGLVGALIFLTKLRVSPNDAFDVNWSALMIFIVVIGGVGTMEGPLLGLLIYFVLRNWLADLGAWYMIVLGGLAIFTILFMRDGIWGWVSRRFDLHLFALQRRLRLLTDAPLTDKPDKSDPSPNGDIQK